MTNIFLSDSFDSAHHLPNVPDGHKCRRTHGHTYRIRIFVSGPVGLESGWVCDLDYAELKAMWLEIKERLDHRYLNEVLPNPTCELIAEYIGECFPPYVSRIELQETEHCGVVWMRPGF